MNEIAVLFDYLSELGVDGFMLSPAFGYESVEEDDEKKADDLFLTRDEIHARFQEAETLLGGHRLTASPIFMDFLTGRPRSRLRRLGQPNAEHPRVERALLSADRQTLRDLPAN